MSGTRVPSAPGPGYDPKWMYWFWDWVRANRPGYVGTGARFTGDVSGTLNAGTSTLSLSTTGVTAGTYGLATSVGQFTVDAKGRLTQAANVGISFPAVAGTSYLTGDVLGTAPLHGTGTTVLSSVVVAGTFGDATVIPRFSIDSKGRVLSGTNAGTLGTFGGFSSLVGAGDLLGTTTTNTFTGALSTTGVTAGTYGGAGTFGQFVVDAKGRLSAASRFDLGAVAPILNTGGTLSHGTSGVAAGTYGAATVLVQAVVDARGHVTSLTAAGTLGTFGGFNSLVGVGDLLGTTTTNTFTGALSTTGVAAGTYGAATIWPRVVVDSKGRLTNATNVGTLGTFGGFNSLVGVGDLLGTTTTNTFTGALSTTGVVAGTYGAPAGVPRFDVDAKGRILNGTTVGTLSSLVIGTGDPSSATALTVLGVARFRRNDTSAEGGQINFDRSFDGSNAWSFDVFGTGTAVDLRLLNNFGITGTSATVPFAIKGATDEVRFTGTATAAFFQGGYRHVGVGDVLGTSLTGTFTAALSTTGVIAGTYSTPTLGIDAKGRITTATSGGSSTWPLLRSYITSTETLLIGTGTQIQWGHSLRIEGTGSASGLLRVQGTGVFPYNNALAFIR